MQGFADFVVSRYAKAWWPQRAEQMAGGGGGAGSRQERGCKRWQGKTEGRAPRAGGGVPVPYLHPKRYRVSKNDKRL